jgi:hypothetical protein
MNKFIKTLKEKKDLIIVLAFEILVTTISSLAVQLIV